MIAAKKRLRGSASIGALAVMLLLTAPCQASITISTGATQFMDCSAGVCSPRADKAVLNVADLEKLLESGATTVTTTGSGGIQAGDIFVSAALTWTSTNALTLDANRSLVIEQPVSVDGVAGLNLVFNTGGKGGPLEFRNQGHVAFSHLSSTLTMNGANYALVNSVRSLATAIAANPAGDFAFARNYNAERDGTYTTSPISTTFSGMLEGLGNSVSNLRVNVTQNYVDVGMIADSSGTISDFGLSGAAVEGTGSGISNIGTLVGDNTGTITGCHATGAVKLTNGGNIGGLVGGSSGTMISSHADVDVTVSNGGNGGGLVGGNAFFGTIEDSYATGAVSGFSYYLGGLVGTNDYLISESFATGPVKQNLKGSSVAAGGLVGLDYIEGAADSYATGTVQGHSWVGGLIGVVNKDGYSGYGAAYSYSTGAVSGPKHKTGGLIGANGAQENNYTYWDTTTSGTDRGVGAGKHYGTVGLTTQQLQSGLPAGFSPRVWAENPHINNGLPYLIANPPPQ